MSNQRYLEQASKIELSETRKKGEINHLHAMINYNFKAINDCKLEIQSLNRSIEILLNVYDPEKGIDFNQIRRLESKIKSLDNDIRDYEESIYNNRQELNIKQKELEQIQLEKQKTINEITDRVNKYNEAIRTANQLSGRYAGVGSKVGNALANENSILAQAAALLGASIHVANSYNTSGGISNSSNQSEPENVDDYEEEFSNYDYDNQKFFQDVNARVNSTYLGSQAHIADIQKIDAELSIAASTNKYSSQDLANMRNKLINNLLIEKTGLSLGEYEKLYYEYNGNNEQSHKDVQYFAKENYSQNDSKTNYNPSNYNLDEAFLSRYSYYAQVKVKGMSSDTRTIRHDLVEDIRQIYQDVDSITQLTNEQKDAKRKQLIDQILRENYSTDFESLLRDYHQYQAENNMQMINKINSNVNLQSMHTMQFDQNIPHENKKIETINKQDHFSIQNTLDMIEKDGSSVEMRLNQLAGQIDNTPKKPKEIQKNGIKMRWWENDVVHLNDQYIPKARGNNKQNYSVGDVKNILAKDYNIIWDGNISYKNDIANFTPTSILRIPTEQILFARERIDPIDPLDPITSQKWETINATERVHILAQAFNKDERSKNIDKIANDVASNVISYYKSKINESSIHSLNVDEEIQKVFPNLTKGTSIDINYLDKIEQSVKGKYNLKFTWDEQLEYGYNLTPTCIHGDLSHTGAVSSVVFAKRHADDVSRFYNERIPKKGGNSVSMEKIENELNYFKKKNFFVDDNEDTPINVEELDFN